VHHGLAPERNREHSIGGLLVHLKVGFMEHLPIDVMGEVMQKAMAMQHDAPASIQ
jgi:hypothetical protein